MAGKNTITRRIALVGGEELEAQLKRLGKAGVDAFNNIQKAAHNVKGPDATFFSKMKQMQDSLTATGKSLVTVGKGVQQFGQQFSRIGLVVGGAVAAFGLLAKSGADAADSMDKAAQKAGLTIESYAKLQFAAEQADVGSDTLQTGITRLSKLMQSAADGSGAAATAFRKLGIDFETAGGKLRPVEDVLADLAGKFNTMPDGAEKTALAMTFLGRSGAQLIPLLNQSSEEMKALFDQVTALGLGFTEAEAKIGDEFGDNLNLLSTAVQRLAQHIGLLFVPALNAATEAVIEFVKNNREAILAFVQGIIDAFNSLPQSVQTTIGVIASSLAGIIVVLGPLAIGLGLFIQLIGFAAQGLGALIGVVAKFSLGIVNLTIALARMSFAAAGAIAALGPWGIIIALVIAALVALAVVVYQNWPQIKKAISDAVDATIKKWNEWKKAASDAVNAVIQFFRNIGAGIARYLGSLIGNAAKAAEAFVSLFTDAFQAVYDFAVGIFDGIMSWIDSVVQAAKDALAVLGALGGGGEGGGFAYGGPVRGRGTSTSDSIPARLSTGEFVVRAAAVRNYGEHLFHRLNTMRVPSPLHLAMGGMVAATSIPMSSPSVASPRAGAGNVNVINLTIGEERFNGLQADDATAAAIARFASSQQLSSAGPSPFWAATGGGD